MIYGIGTDIAKVDRFQKWIETEKMCRRFFNESEILPEGSNKAKCEHYAARFAAKEAFAKALGTGFTGIELRDIFVTNDYLGKPIMNITGNVKQVLDEKFGNYVIHLSLSHEKEYAVAFVIIESQ